MRSGPPDSPQKLRSRAATVRIGATPLRRVRGAISWLSIAMLAGAPLTAAAQAPPSAASQSIPAGCFMRNYDQAHLSRQTSQQVTAMRVSLVDDIIPGSIGVPPQTFVRLELTRRSDPKPVRAIGTCAFDRAGNRTVNGRPVIATYPQPGGIMCMIAGENLDAEGGEVILERVGRTLTVHIADVTVRRASTVSAHPGQWMDFGKADRVFRLSQTDKSQCRNLERAISFR